ncbi:MAG TPA: hypothetical protein VM223_03460 [Planctomycetota bacterium]|nr:hypothetical protein [Planctomycetota bacterium]
MADDDTINDAIEDSAESGIRRASGDSGSMEEHSLPDRIKAAKFAASRTASRKTGLGIKLLKISPPGSV